MILRHIQSQLQFDLHHQINKWIGTSTGALINASLIVQKDISFIDAIQNVLDIYEFRSNSSINPLSDKNPERAFHKLLDENFGHFSLKDFPELHITVCTQNDLSLKVFNDNDSINLAEALKASCAVPGLFKPVKIGDVFYVDGFYKAKNPSEILIKELSSEDIFLSIGTGILKTSDEIETQIKNVHENCLQFATKNDIHYFRFNPRLNDAADSMQDTRLKNIFALKKDCENYLLEKKELINDLIRLLI